jgi:hypothetical protein
LGLPLPGLDNFDFDLDYLTLVEWAGFGVGGLWSGRPGTWVRRRTWIGRIWEIWEIGDGWIGLDDYDFD